jgi:hypothetical protein
MLTYNFYDDADSALPTSNSRSPATYGGDGTNVASLSPNGIKAGSEMTFVYRPDFALAAGSNLILKFPPQFDLPIVGASCFINYNTAETCYTFPDADWIIFSGTTTAMSVATEYSFTIKGLFNPKNRLNPRAPIEIISIGPAA